MVQKRGSSDKLVWVYELISV